MHFSMVPTTGTLFKILGKSISAHMVPCMTHSWPSITSAITGYRCLGASGVLFFLIQAFPLQKANLDQVVRLDNLHDCISSYPDCLSGLDWITYRLLRCSWNMYAWNIADCGHGGVKEKKRKKILYHPYYCKHWS